MKTTVENLLKIEGSELHESEKVSLVFVYGSAITEIRIYYKFFKNPIYSPEAYLRFYDDDVIPLHFFDDVEEVLNQIYYITGYKLSLK